MYSMRILYEYLMKIIFQSSQGTMRNSQRNMTLRTRLLVRVCAQGSSMSARPRVPRAKARCIRYSSALSF